ncbi:UbiH/UbiF family hydroxylase [Rhizobium binae]|uniref:2-octaprenyl-6-methoxyphenol hydroxylase n=1 Tax=Rhizobium binae TaxID=1138190 RepID=A0ABV2ME37_9HYPH|nr:UbiH/UbiF family hydroxylase [Rhizobium binae]NKL47222.1 UbiH/UbiF family hydroxylase [Rhizobium leguminosarum bv. viciae]MBX4941116.1 UbiH/UbiF family hydroxylase [Rhizobium binae]MBX4943501.1 UbiH/UbiF family hydroxylase [Rhizobium binae]MBX4961341.1 UbiH/UbiF family hydroxylase [Rhizobium binae]MBX4966866.1 UbiH/UbiF family hydroxylase [Rhizobium binae]
MKTFEIAVIGGGLAGMIAAIALARGGRNVALVAPLATREDRRTTALMDQSISFLDRLALWEKLRPAAAPLTSMRIIDGTDRLLRAPTTTFRAAEVGLDAFGYNFPNKAMTDILEQATAGEGNISRFPSMAESIEISAERVSITLAGGETFAADFAVGADGRGSKLRETAGIGVRNWSYPQSAMVLNFAHSLPHQNISSEFHTKHGPFTQVPLPGSRSSLVWVQDPAEAAARMELPLAELGRLVEAQMQSMLGKVDVEEGVQLWPLSGMMAHRFGKGRIALIGEAAHVFPPIGAQGLNLSLRDIMALTDILCDRAELPVPADAGDSFDRKRRADIMTRTASVDLLNRSLLSDFLPVQMLRAAGLHILSAIPPLRNLVMREGIEPGRGFRDIPDSLREKLKRKKA